MAVGLVVAVAAVGAAWVTLHGLGQSAPSSPTRLERLQGAATDIRSALGKVQGELDRNRKLVSTIVARQSDLTPLLSHLAAKYRMGGPKERSRLRREIQALRAHQESLTQRLQLLAAHHGELVAKARSLQDMLDRIPPGHQEHADCRVLHRFHLRTRATAEELRSGAPTAVPGGGDRPGAGRCGARRVVVLRSSGEWKNYRDVGNLWTLRYPPSWQVQPFGSDPADFRGVLVSNVSFRFLHPHPTGYNTSAWDMSGLPANAVVVQVQLSDFGPLGPTVRPGPGSRSPNGGLHLVNHPLGFLGLDVEPNTITNFDGFAAMAYLNGTATDADGNSYAIGLSAMRVFQGFYRTADGSLGHGTFVFI